MATAYNAVPIGIRVTGESYVESVLQVDHPRHGVQRRRIHSDLTVPIDCHEAEGRIDDVVHYLQVESVVFADSLPVSHAGPTQRIDTEAKFALADCFKIDHRRQIADIRIKVLKGMYIRRFTSAFKRHSLHAAQVFSN